MESRPPETATSAGPLGSAREARWARNWSGRSIARKVNLGREHHTPSLTSTSERWTRVIPWEVSSQR